MYSVGSFVCGLIATSAILGFWLKAVGRGEDPIGMLFMLVAAGALIVFGGTGAVLGVAGLYLGDRRRWAAAGLVLSLWPWALLLVGATIDALT